MTIMSDLPGDLVEDILSRVPLTYLRKICSTCKAWNALSKTLGLAFLVKKHYMAFTVIDYNICLFRFKLQGILNRDDLADPFMKKASIPQHLQVKISRVFHCDGLLLCVLIDTSMLLVWNPYLGQTRWLQPTTRPISSFYRSSNMYDIGYEGDNNNNRNHKILRFSMYYNKAGTENYLIDVFDFRSASWRVLDVNPIPIVDFLDLFCYRKSVSLKGNTYFCSRAVAGREYYLQCFDFTKERFGPLLPLPQDYPLRYVSVTLSCVRDEKLALLYNHYKESDTIVIWITTKIEPDAVSWTKFLTLDIKPESFLQSFRWIFYNGGSFFVDEEKKVAVVFHLVYKTSRNQMAYIIGEDGYFKSVNIGEPLYTLEYPRIACSSYAPSLVQLQV